MISNLSKVNLTQEILKADISEHDKVILTKALMFDDSELPRDNAFRITTQPTALEFKYKITQLRILYGQ